MGGKYKLVLAAQYFFCQLHSDLMGFLWRHLPRLKSLDQVAAQVRALVDGMAACPFNSISAVSAAQPKDGLLVCPGSDGNMMSDTGWKRMWDSYLTDLNLKYGAFHRHVTSKYDPHGVPMVIPHFTAHWLRHTFCSLLYMAGIDVVTAKEQMGHADIKTTLAIYTHLDAQYKKNTMEKLDAFLEETNASHMQVK